MRCALSVVMSKSRNRIGVTLKHTLLLSLLSDLCLSLRDTEDDLWSLGQVRTR